MEYTVDKNIFKNTFDYAIQSYLNLSLEPAIISDIKT